ncbi:MAG: hypothetical protein HQM15_09255 [Deltaproteobacteria bacterium]|nr:hypothetical protein [Deltaproteobacteria bacterium]
MFNLQKTKNVFVGLIFTCLVACGGGGLQTSPAPNLNENNTPAALSLSSNYPADIDIVSGDPALKDIAFITSSSGSPALVFAVNLSQNPLQISTQFRGLPTLVSAGIPNNLVVLDSTHAFLLTSDKLIYFDPKEGSVKQEVDLTEAITLSDPVRQVNASSVAMSDLSGTFIPSFPASLAVSGNRIAVSFSNLNYAPTLTAAQGLVRFYDYHPENSVAISSSNEHWFTHCGSTAQSGFNTSGLTVVGDGRLLVTCTGLTRLDLSARSSLPVTPAGIDVLDFATGDILASLDLGLTAPAFRSWAVSSDRKKAYLGSSSGGYLLQLSLEGDVTLERGLSNPIVITDSHNGSDFMDEVLISNDNSKLFAFSSNSSSVYTLDLTQTNMPILTQRTVDLSAAGSPGGITGVGPAALRQGRPGVDFTGPDLWVLTGNPGTLAAIRSY